MSTGKLNLQTDLKELQARIYLDTKKKLTKKDILEIASKIGAKNYNQLIEEIEKGNRSISPEKVSDLRLNAMDFGEGTENLSEDVDTIYK